MGRSRRPRPARLAAKLRQIRITFGLTQQEMIKRLGYRASPLHPQNVSGYESGEREPPLPILLKYARVAGICLDELVDDDLDLPKRLPSTPKHKKLKN
jgi:transcriptional regulator with XRE-family HTH domain